MASTTPQAPAQGMDAIDTAEVNMDTSTSSSDGDDADSSVDSSACSSLAPSTEALPGVRSDGSMTDFTLSTSPRISIIDMETGGICCDA